MKIIFLLVMAAISISFGFSQPDQQKNYVYLFSDTLIMASKVEYKKPFIGSGHFTVDTLRFEPTQVKFYHNEEGYFANTKNLKAWRESMFTERIIAGKINLYETEQQIIMSEPSIPLRACTWAECRLLPF